MDKNKQKKKIKLKTKLISIAMLAIILVTMFALPISALEEGESFIGIWIINETFDYSLSSGDKSGLAYAEGKMNLVTSTSQTEPIIADIRQIGFYAIQRNDEAVSAFVVSTFYDGDFTYYTYINNEILVAESLGDVDFRIDSNHPLYNDLRTIQLTSEITSVQNYGDGHPITVDDVYNALINNATYYTPPEPKTPLGNILDVFLGIGGWIATAVTSLIGIFYSAEAGKLTVIGVLSVASLAISVIFLLIGVIQNFMHFRS